MTHILTYIYIYINAYTYICIHMHTLFLSYAHTYIYIHTHTYMSIFLVGFCIYIYIVYVQYKKTLCIIYHKMSLYDTSLELLLMAVLYSYVDIKHPNHGTGVGGKLP